MLATEDSRLKSSRSGVRWRPAWRFPKATEAFIRDLLATCDGPSLHVCSGASSLGDVKADMYHPAATVKCDMYRLPFRSGTFGAALCDPPFPGEGQGGLSLPQRLAQFQEIGRVVRKGGVVLLHAPWMPRPTWAHLEAAWVRDQGSHGFPHAPVLLTLWRRVLEPSAGDPADEREEAGA